MMRYLQGYGFNVCGFTKPNLALEHFKVNSKGYAIVISDLQMPGMSGFEFTRIVKETDSNVKVFLMTINDLALSRITLFTQRTIDEFIQKPFSIDKLPIALTSI